MLLGVASKYQRSRLGAGERHDVKGKLANAKRARKVEVLTSPKDILPL